MLRLARGFAWLLLPALVAVGCGGRAAEREGAGADSVDAGVAAGKARLAGVVTAVDAPVPGPGTILQVMLTEGSFSGTGYTRLAVREIDVSGQAWPIPFAIDYESAAVDTAKTYVVWAMLVVGQRPLLEQERFVRVLTRGAPTDSVSVAIVPPGEKAELLPDAGERAVPHGQ